MSCRIAIVGGGAAGILAGLAANRHGAEAVIFERNSRIGIKILISGGGRCNITHAADPSGIEHGFLRDEGRFLRYALHELPPATLLEMLRSRGLETTTRSNGRVFPASGRAEDVLATFEAMLSDAGVVILAHTLVQGLETDEGGVSGVRHHDLVERFDAVIITTGGMSYKAVGTTGDGIRWARELGIASVPVRAALAPIYFPEPPPPAWHGVALRDVQLRIECDGHEHVLAREGHAVEWRGDLLLTHRGASGPAVLELSRAAALARERGHSAALVVDLLPEVGPERMSDLWSRFHADHRKGEIQSFVETAVPRSLVPYLLAQSGLEPGRRIADIARVERSRLLQVLKGWRVGEVGTIPLDRGEVTAGGVALSEIDPRTMRARRVQGLYVAGEALDVAGPVGGYNLQAAFATGYVAGRSAANDCRP